MVQYHNDQPFLSGLHRAVNSVHIDILREAQAQQLEVIIVSLEFGERGSYISTWLGKPDVNLGDGLFTQVTLINGEGEPTYDYVIGDDDTSVILAVVTEIANINLPIGTLNLQATN
tara:strand:- start:622 stop:969 length:348 start_codon:yes stop_codon:yes gene_type:complete